MRTKSATRLLASIHYSLVIVCELYLTCTTIHVNIYTSCILILVRSSCTREHHKSYLWNVSRPAEEHECFCELRHELYCTVVSIRSLQRLSLIARLLFPLLFVMAENEIKYSNGYASRWEPIVKSSEKWWLILAPRASGYQFLAWARNDG